jgi:hypothetical protein
VREQTQRLLDAGREDGFIFASSHDITRAVPPENVVAMMEVVCGETWNPGIPVVVAQAASLLYRRLPVGGTTPFAMIVYTPSRSKSVTH